MIPWGGGDTEEGHSRAHSTFPLTFPLGLRSGSVHMWR